MRVFAPSLSTAICDGPVRLTISGSKHALDYPKFSEESCDSKTQLFSSSLPGFTCFQVDVRVTTWPSCSQDQAIHVCSLKCEECLTTSSSTRRRWAFSLTPTS